MVKKWVYRLPASDIEAAEEDSSDSARAVRSALLRYNHQLHACLKQFKNNIEDVYAKTKWDRLKKFANEYELVFTSCLGYPSICRHAPISRSFFKMWETLHDFPEAFYTTATTTTTNASSGPPQPPITLTCLAEGPGGFMEAILKKRQQAEDCVYGITLLSGQRNIPHWKLKSPVFKHPRMHLLAGADGTGDLTRLANIDSYVQTIGANACHVVTADGGFDFSSDFNNQELMSLRLIACEVFLALQIQKEGGTFFLKIYDIFTNPTLQMLYILRLFYQDLTFVKPLTSRPANSEKYVLCTGFSPHRHCKVRTAVLRSLRDAVAKGDFTQMLPASVMPLPVSFLRSVLAYNQHAAHKQILSIMYTLTYIIEVRADQNNMQFVRCLKNQLSKAIRWCNKYGLDIDTRALKAYASHYST
jgi:23S rRNA U2552 (ribose-2'-O)-methylase RlmE/FtsJ